MVDKTLTINGTMIWNSGIKGSSGSIIIGASGLLNLSTSAMKQIQGVLTNNGTIDWQDGSVNWGSGSSNTIIYNYGNFNISGNDNDAGTNPCIIYNYGSISKNSAGDASLTHLLLFNNIGTVNLNSGTLLMDCSIINSGDFSFNGGKFTHQSSTFNQEQGGILSGSGEFIANSGELNIKTNQDWPVGITFIQNADEVNILVNCLLTIRGQYTLNRGAISGPGEILIATGAQLNFATSSPKTIRLGSTITNNGILNWNGGNLNWGNGIQTINNLGEFNIGVNNSNASLNTASSPGTAVINNFGTFLKFTTSSTNFGGVTLNNHPGKVIRSVGSINLNTFNNDGVLEIGHPIGIFEMNGSQPFSSNSTLEIELNGSGLGTGYDVFERNSGSALVLSGTLNVTQTSLLPNGTYHIITGNNISGSFSTVNLPDFCTLQISSTAVDVVRNGPEAGDYRTKQDGDWGYISTWERFNGFNWQQYSTPNEDAGTITISHDITVTSLGITDGDQIMITGTGSLTINSRFFLRDGPGDDLLNNSGDGITINYGGILSGNGTVNNQGRADVHGVGSIAVPFVNNGNFFFTHATEGCCPSGLINLSDGITTGRIDNHGSFFIYATPGISVMNILNGEFHNHTDGVMNMEYTTTFTVNRFTNEGEFFLGGNPNTEYICTINSTEGVTHRGRFKSNGNNKKFVLNTNGIFTYASDCIIDGNMHYVTGTHEIFSTYYGHYDSRVSTTVNCNGIELNFPGTVYVDAGNFGGPAIKKIGGSLIWWAGTISGGNLIINDTASAHFGAGQTTFGTLATTLVNNGTINLFTAYGGCCAGPVLTMTNGTIENNGQFIFHPTGGGGIYNETLSGGVFNNNTGGTLINNATAVSPWGDNEIYLRNNIFTNNGLILANGKSLNIFPTTDPVINGTITAAAGAQVKFGLPSTTTTFAPTSVVNGAGTIYFFEGNHQVNTTFYDVGATSIGQTYYPANVYFNTSNVSLNYVHMSSGILGGAATKLLKDDMVFSYGQITGGPISNTDTSVFHYGAGKSDLGAMNTAFTNNGTVEVSAYYGGCCSGPTIDLTGGSITNNKTFNVTGSGGIYYVAMNNGSFINNATGVINCNIGDVAFGERVFKMHPASFTNYGTINVLRNIMELGAFTVGGEINVSANSLLRSTGTITFDGSLINNNGNITAPFNFITTPAKVLKGTGTFSSSMVLNNTSTVEPGSSPGILMVAGNYTQGDAALNIEIGGTTPGTEYDRLSVTGTATLSGTLNATEINGFNPQSLTSIDIITAGAVSGTFSQVNLPTSWSVQYAANKVSLVKFFEFVYYRDADNDSYGNLSDTIHSFLAAAPPGYTVDSTDCDDTNSAVNPGATEVCDGVDNDCDGNTDAINIGSFVCGMAYSEGQSFTLTAPPGKVFTSVDFASYGTPDGTCGNFTLGSCHATSTMAIVESLVIGQNSVTLTQNYQIFGDPCVGVYKRFYVQARYSEFISLSQTYYADADGDGFGDPVVSLVDCSQPNGYVLNNTDCNDNSAAAYPGATEICDGIDNDCDGLLDTVEMNEFTPGLVAYYRLNGNAADTVGSVNGTINGGVTPANNRFGIAGNSCNFNAVNGFIDISANTNTPASGSVSVSVWINYNASSANLNWFKKGTSNGYGLFVLNNTVYVITWGVINWNTGVTLIPNTWFHITFTFDGTTQRIYKNGILAASVNAGYGYASGFAAIGYNAQCSECGYFNGLIDELKVFNIALSASQVLQQYNLKPLSKTYYADSDGDGFGNPAISQVVCSQPTGSVLNNTDCDDTHNTVYPGAPEICDGLDNDCDSLVDIIAGNPVCPPSITLNLQLLLEGFYTGNSSMRASLYDLALSTLPTETDTITVNLWSPANLSNAAPDQSIKAIVHTNGEASVEIPAVVSGNPYYIAVKHRNHVETWSKLPISFSTNTINYFFDGPDKAFNNNLLLQADGKYVIYGGDVNQDGVVDQNDIDNIHNAANTFTTGYMSADANGDGIVDALDMIITDNNAARFIVKITP